MKCPFQLEVAINSKEYKFLCLTCQIGNECPIMKSKEPPKEMISTMFFDGDMGQSHSLHGDLKGLSYDYWG